MLAYLLGVLFFGQTGGYAPPPADRPGALAAPAALPPLESDANSRPALPPARANEWRLAAPPSAAPAEAPNAPAAGRPSQDLVSQCLALPEGHAIVGQPYRMLSGLTAVTDRRQQLEFARAYWRLVECIGGYCVALEEAGRVGQVREAPGGDARVRLARAASAAAVGEAEAAAVSAQHDLAAIVRLPPEQPLPLPVEPPHAGPYKTLFAEMFAGRAAPAVARHLDQMLPLRRRAIDARAEAVAAAEAALVAVASVGRGSAGEVALCVQNVACEKRAFLAAVCRYNAEIAEYALTVAQPGASRQLLLSMLIVNGAGAGAGVEAGATAEAVSAAPKATIAAPGLQPATFAQPVVPLRPRRNEPTPADPRTRPKPSADDLLPLETGPQTLPAMPELRDAGEPPARLSIPAGEPPRRVEPVELPRATFAPVPTAGEARQAMKVGAYDTELTPGAQAKQIALALHAARPMPAAAGQPLSLRDCLAQRGQTDRQTVIDAYWLLAQRVAEYHLAGQRLQWCGELLSVVERAGSAAALAQVQAAQQSAAAAIEDARLAMLDAQFDLARRMTLAEAVAPPLPSTAPHWGRYLTDAERLPQPAAAAWSLRRLAGLIGARAVVIQRQAAAVVAAEDARQSTAAGLSRQGGVAAALEAVAAQAAAAQQMLRTLTEHNSAIAEYALSVLPPQVGDDELLAALVVKN